MSAEPAKVTTFWLPERLLDRLQARAANEGRKRNALVKELLTTALDDESGPPSVA